MIIIDVLGGLGNQLYHMALFEYLKQHYTNRKILLQLKYEVDRHINLNYFDSILKNWKTAVNNNVSCSNIIREHNLNPVDVLNISSEPTVLYGYFQTYKYITDSFVTKLSFSNEILSKYPNINNLVFIHIRGGDFLEERYALHRIDLTTYYENAIKCFDEDTQFCIFTNDIVYAKSFSFLQQISHIFIEEDQLDTLNLMSHCKGGICANSSFSWWGARLNPNRKLILPSKWYNDSSFYTTGYYFPEATVIDVGLWSFIDKVVYINLDHRTDRNEHMKNMTRTFGNKVSRFSAIKKENGAMGCTLSHIQALKKAIQENYENILILEDDAEWNNFEESYQILKKLSSNPYDVIMLGGSFVSYNSENYKVDTASTTTGYLVNKHYMQTLLSNFKEGLEQQLLIEYRCGSFAIDVYWRSLQKTDNWFIVQPPLIYQTPSYSDIENYTVDYRRFMGIVPDTPLLDSTPLAPIKNETVDIVQDTSPLQQIQQRPAIRFLRRFN